MPVAKVKNYDTVIKNLRGREIPCFVIAVPKRSSGESTTTEGTTESSFIWLNEKNKRISGKKSYRKSNLNKEPPQSKKRPKSFPDFTDHNALSEAPKKRVYRKKSLNLVSSRIDNSSQESNLCVTPANGEVPKKRVYRKKVLNVVTLEPKFFSEASTSTTEVDGVVPFSSGDIRKKRTYRKKIFSEPSPSNTGVNNTLVFSPESVLKKRVYRKKIPAVPHNTPVMAGYKFDTSSASSMSEPSDLFQKRGRGRPPSAKKSLPKAIPVWDEESTCTSSTLSGVSQDSERDRERSTTRRPRRSRYFFDDFDTEEEEQVSEYELLRQRNIEENRKMLRQIFSENGLQFEEKPSETPKVRKTYSKVPLPPPRPKSARIEIRSSYEPLDFSKFNHKLSLT